MKKLLVLLGWMFCTLLHAGDLTVSGINVHLIGDRPGAQKTLIVLSKSISEVTSNPETWAPVIPELLKKKWMIAVVDLPYVEGNEFVHNITQKWKTRMDEGENVIEDFSVKLSAVVDRLLFEKLANPRYLYLFGRGEGGILALDAMATDNRYKACALLQPITDLRAFPHYASFAQTNASNAIIRSCSAKLKGQALSDKSIRLLIGPDDRLNDTQAAVEFMGSIRVGADVELTIKPALMSAGVGAESLVKFLLEKK